MKPEQEASPSEDFSPELTDMADNMSDVEKFRLLEEEHDLLKEAVRMALDTEHAATFYVEQLNEQIAARKCYLQGLENKWEVTRKPLEEKKWDLLDSFCATNPGCEPQLRKLKETEMETCSILCEIRKREEECMKLTVDLSKQPKFASRRSYIQRITEISKNSRKLDVDIECILKDIRELQLESNSIEERLHRTYGVINETIFREAKSDSTCRQVYRLLTSVHENFEEIREKILAADKARREAAELEAKLSIFASRDLDMDKLQADLDALRKENEQLEKTLQSHS